MDEIKITEDVVKDLIKELIKENLSISVNYSRNRVEVKIYYDGDFITSDFDYK